MGPPLDLILFYGKMKHINMMRNVLNDTQNNQRPNDHFDDLLFLRQSFILSF